jgi:hypothetical protein
MVLPVVYHNKHAPPLLLTRAPTATALRMPAKQLRIRYKALLHTGIVYTLINVI